MPLVEWDAISGIVAASSGGWGLAVGATAGWSGGEDSSGSRRVVGVQMVPLVAL